MSPASDPIGLAPKNDVIRYARYVAALAIGAAPILAIITSLWLFPAAFPLELHLLMGIFAVSFPLVVRRLAIPKRTGFLNFLILAGFGLALVSVFTGGGNGLTDEPFTTPRYAGLLFSGHDPYNYPLIFNYVQYGQTIHSVSIYVYLPLLMFLQVPYVDYKVFAIACWLGIVALVRKDFYATVALGQPYVALMAASGFNDLPVLLLMTVGFVGIHGKRQKWAELLSLGCKQFANVVVFLYYVFQRDWRNAFVTAGVTAAFLLPFLYWDWTSTICHAGVYDRLSFCARYSSYIPWALNYSLYPLWAAAIFYPAILAGLRRGRWASTLRRSLSLR